MLVQGYSGFLDLYLTKVPPALLRAAAKYQFLVSDLFQDKRFP